MRLGRASLGCRPDIVAAGDRWLPCEPRAQKEERLGQALEGGQSEHDPRGADIAAFVRKAVRIGVPVEELTSLSRLLDPALVERVLEAYQTENGGNAKTYTIELGWKLLS